MTQEDIIKELEAKSKEWNTSLGKLYIDIDTAKRKKNNRLAQELDGYCLGVTEANSFINQLLTKIKQQ